MLFFGRPRWRVIAGPLAALMLLAAAVVAGAAPATAASVGSASSSAARPVAGKAPLSQLIGQPVRHVTPPVAPRQASGAPEGQLKLPAGAHSACPATKPGQISCASVVRPASSKASGTTSAGAASSGAKAGANAAAAATVSGYSPAQLQAAYGLTSASATGGIANGAPEVVAIPGVYDDPTAAADLAAYRTQFGLTPCVTTAGGSLPLGSGCVTKVNENNQTSPLPSAPPASDADWTAVDSATMEMVTAICPNCQILLVEAGSSSIADGGQDLITAENDADVIAGGWGSVPFAGESADDQAYLNAPGKAVVFAAGDNGAGTYWPASSQFVTAAGGTTLTADTSTSRGYTESAWSGTSGGCATMASPKPSWQTDTGSGGCDNRTQNDVSAAASSVAVYDSTASVDGDGRATGWNSLSTTALSAGIIAGVYALNGLPQAGTYPASYPYQSGASSHFNDITSGSDGTCESSRSYVCTAGTGYDGPTGVGSPNGTAGLTDQASGDTVAVPDPGTKNYAQNAKVNIPLRASGSDASQAITWTASGLPPSLSINSATGAITGTAPASPGTSKITATATDATGASGSVSFKLDAIGPLNSKPTPASGHYASSVSNICINDPNAKTAAGSPVSTYACESAATENWTYTPSAAPGAAGQVSLVPTPGDCLAASGIAAGSLAVLEPCSGTDGHQGWQLQSDGALYNPYSGKCLADPGNSTANNTQLTLAACNTATAGQQWTLPAGQILNANHSGTGGRCLDDYQASAANNAVVDSFDCNGTGAQAWTLEPDGTIRVQGTCLDMTQASTLDGGPAELYSCIGVANEQWELLPDGEIMNAHSGKCLDDTTGVEGTRLQQQDCTAEPGEIWEAS